MRDLTRERAMAQERRQKALAGTRGPRDNGTGVLAAAGRQMLLEGNLDGAIVALRTAFEQDPSLAREVGTNSEKVRRASSSKAARRGEPAAILESLCMCLAKKGDWPGVHEYCSLALDRRPDLQQQLPE
ncbi:unnamed protein product, partial [Prorocentrum cordatum]